MHTDDELYHLFLSGDTTSYDELMIRHGDSLTVYLNGYLHDWQDSEDLMIEAFARIMVKRPRMNEGKFKAYLFKTARNLASRFHSVKRRMDTFSLDSMNQEVQNIVLQGASGAAANDHGAQRIVDDERREMLMMCLDRIDPELREALWLVYMEELTYNEAALVMGVKPKRVDHLLTRGKEHMRRELAKEGIRNAYE